MKHPFQCIATVESTPALTDGHGYLLAACGPKLLSICLSTGVIVSEWTVDRTTSHDEERPPKKQKTVLADAALPNIIRLSFSPDGQHAVAVTDDKCVRVFAVERDGKLAELSQRFMPKRPCAIEVLPNNSTILCGDKFGDVYSLPLLPEIKGDQHGAGFEEKAASADGDSVKAFKPSATNLTVHTQRNRKALESQLKQKNLSQKTKEPLKFEHKLLLGHVSMLTDVVYATRGVVELGEKQRGYIITADRDEHIRISRGPPQSHVIEGYCLGHKQFVSKLFLIPGTDLLVSGGGDDWLGIWEWPTFKLRRKIDFGNAFRRAASMEEGAPLAISGLWSTFAWIGPCFARVVAIACEKVPVLAYIESSQLRADVKDPDLTVEIFDAPILDVASVGPTTIISFDVREAGQKRIGAYRLQGKWVSECKTEVDKVIEPRLECAHNVVVEDTNEKSLEGLLYGVANLRKRGYADDHDEEV